MEQTTLLLKYTPQPHKWGTETYVSLYIIAVVYFTVMVRALVRAIYAGL